MPRPIADWRNPDAPEYPKRGARLSPGRWAWEFLRRHPGYQDAWQSFQGVVAAILAENGGDESMIEDDPRFWHHEPGRMAGEDDAAWLARVKRGTRTAIDNWIAKEWGLVGCIPILPDPFAAPAFVGFSSGARVTAPGRWQAAMPSVMQPEMAFVIDFRKPIDGQIEVLRRYAESHQKWLIEHGVIETPATINERPEWPIYLRLLDAELDSATDPGELAKVLFPCESNEYPDYRVSHKIAKAQDRARQLRDIGYLWIAAIKPKGRKNSGA